MLEHDEIEWDSVVTADLTEESARRLIALLTVGLQSLKGGAVKASEFRVPAVDAKIELAFRASHKFDRKLTALVVKVLPGD